MGGSSSSSTNQETTTNQTDRRIGATDSAVIFAPEADSPITITMTDALAFETVNAAGELITATMDRAFLTADHAVSAAEKSATSSAQSASDASQSNNGKDIANAVLMAGLAYGAYKFLKG